MLPLPDFARRNAEYTVWDTRTPGLGVRVRPSGATTFVLLRKTDGRSTRRSLGSVASQSVEDARRHCHALLATPDSEPPTRRARNMPLFRAFVLHTWKNAHFPRYKPWTRRGNALRPHQSAPACLRRNTARPHHPQSRAGLVRWLQPSRARRRQPCSAHLAPDSRVRHCPRPHQHQSRARRGHEPPNPAHPLSLQRRTPASAPRTRPTRPNRHSPLTPGGHHPLVLLLTGCRKSEILALRWNEIDGDTIALADAKAGPRKVNLGSRARRIIERQPRGRRSVRVSLSPQSRPSARPQSPSLGPGPQGGPPSRTCACMIFATPWPVMPS